LVPLFAKLIILQAYVSEIFSKYIGEIFKKGQLSIHFQENKNTQNYGVSHQTLFSHQSYFQSITKA
jgi:hypothetical protein